MLHDHLVRLFKKPLSLKSLLISFSLVFLFSLATFSVYLTGRATQQTQINIAPKAAEMYVTPTSVSSSSAY